MTFSWFLIETMWNVVRKFNYPEVDVVISCYDNISFNILTEVVMMFFNCSKIMNFL